MKRVILSAIGLTFTLILVFWGASCTRNNVLPVIKPKPNFNIKDSILVPKITINRHPDSTYSVDMDHDGVMDIQFTLNASGWWYGPEFFSCLNSSVHALNSNTTVSPGIPNGGWQVIIYPLNSIIDGSRRWTPSLDFYICTQGGGGVWFYGNNSTAPEGIVGVQIVKGGKSYFGWIQFMCDGNYFTFERYAMDLNSNPYILAGQTH